MDRTTRILIVEDDMIIGANISLQLSNLGYEVTGIESRGEEAIVHARENTPDLLLLDINLKGSLSGIDTAMAIQKFRTIPIVYLTANGDEDTFSKAKETHPKAFITKPFNKLDLQRTLELVVAQIKDDKSVQDNGRNMEVMEDRIFVRHRGKMEKLLLEDIFFVEANRNYCTLVTDSGKYVLSSTLKTMEQLLPKTQFTRVHRSFIVKLSKLDVVADQHVEIGRNAIPIGKSYKETLLNRIRTI